MTIADTDIGALNALPKGDILLSYQGKSHGLLDTTALLVIEKSRRIGMTWGLAGYAVIRAGLSKLDGGMDTLYISYSQEMTREFIDACAMWARAFNIGCGASQDFLFQDDDSEKSINAFRIKFASGNEIVGLSSAPRGLRGKQGFVIIDEAAFVDSLEELLKSAMAMMIWGGRVCVVSTHNGSDNAFNKLIEEIRAGRKEGLTQRVTFADAVEAGLYDRIAMLSRKKLPPEAEWVAQVRGFYGDDVDEELDCIPRTGSGSWLNAKDLNACLHKDAGKPEFYEGGICYGGRDVARRRDLSVMFPFEDVGSDLWLRERVEMQNASFADQDKEFDRLMKFYRIVRFKIDQTGMGEKVVEDLQAKYGSERVEGVLFTGPSKLDLASAVRKRVEDRTIWLPDDPVFKTDLLSIKRTAGTGNAVRLAEDGSSDAHADRFWACALACLAAESPYQKYTYTPAQRLQHQRERLGDDDQIGRGMRSRGLFS